VLISVLSADPHAIFRQGLASLLEKAEDISLVAQATNGQEAWDLIVRLQPDVAILDLSMPEMTGIEVSRKTQAAGLDTRVMLLTMHQNACAAIDAQAAGTAGYLIKDNSFEELAMAVRTVAAGGTFITPVIRAKLQDLQRSGKTTKPPSLREREVIRLIALGKSGKEIARLMGISARTVETHRERLMAKLQLHSVADVVRYAFRAGIVT